MLYACIPHFRVDYDPQKVRLGISQRIKKNRKEKKRSGNKNKSKKTELEIADDGERLMSDLDMLYRIGGKPNSKRKQRRETGSSTGWTRCSRTRTTT